MDKFVIVMVEDESGDTKYWDGRRMSDDPNACLLYATKVDARSDMAALVSSFNTSELSVRKATVTVVIE